MAERLVYSPQEVERLRLARDLGISYRRLHGWEPSGLERGYDRDGNQVPLSEAWEIVTESESEWDDDERARMLALGRYEAGICDCGVHESLTGDRSNHFTFEKRTCPVCRGLAQWVRVLADEDDEVVKARGGDNMQPAEPRPADGRRLSVRQMSPFEVAERRAAQNPPSSGA